MVLFINSAYIFEFDDNSSNRKKALETKVDDSCLFIAFDF